MAPRSLPENVRISWRWWPGKDETCISPRLEAESPCLLPVN